MKPKYNFFKNTSYALNGLKSMLSESSFKIELLIILPLLICSIFLPVSMESHLLLVIVLAIVLIAECVNTGIEVCVDLITQDFHPLAKVAKDVGSAAVMLSILNAAVVWIFAIFSLLVD